MKNLELNAVENPGFKTVKPLELNSEELLEINGGGFRHFFSISPGWIQNVLDFANGFVDSAKECDC